MCKFLSGLAFGPKLEGKYGKFYAAPAHTDSHSDMERKLGLPAKNDHHWAKWEFVPGSNILDFASYKFRLDEERKPDWWTDEIEFEAKQFALRQLAECFVSENLETLERDVYALCGAAVVNKLCSQVRVMLGSAQVGEMLGSAKVGVMWGSAQVSVMRDDAHVGVMRDDAQVREMWGSAQVGEMWDDAQVGEMRDDAQVGEMLGSAQVREMWGSAKVGVMWGSAQVSVMREGAQVGVMRESAQVGVMREIAIARRCTPNGIQILHAPEAKIQLATVADIPEWAANQEVSE